MGSDVTGGPGTRARGELSATGGLVVPLGDSLLAHHPGGHMRRAGYHLSSFEASPKQAPN